MTNEEIIQQGGGDMLARLWDNNRGFIYQQARRWSKQDPGIFEDLMQSGFLAIADAVDRYKPEAGAFITFLSFYIKKHFALCCAASSGWNRQQWEEQRDASPEKRIMVDSLHRPIANDDGDTMELGDLIADPEDQIAELLDRLESNALHSKLEELLAGLDKTEEQVVRLRYYKGYSTAQIEQELGIYHTEYNRLYQSAFVKLRRMAAHTELEDYIDRRTNYYFRVGVDAFQSTGISAVEHIAMKREEMLARLLYKAKGDRKNDDNTNA